MRKLRYHLIGVFTNQAFGGNQLAVFTNGRGLPPHLMQQMICGKKASRILPHLICLYLP